MPSNHLILCHLLLLPSVFPSIRVFSNESVLCIRWKNYWSLSFRISPFNEYSGLISFSIDQFDLLAVQRTLKNLHQHSRSKASIPQCSVSLRSRSHIHPDYLKTIALIRWHYIYIYKHMCTHIYVRNSFEKEYNSILDKEIKSTSIYIYIFLKCAF